MSISEKKFFSETEYTPTLRRGARWYIEFYEKKFEGVYIRRRTYGGLNRIKDLELREARAAELMAQLNTRADGKVKSALLDTLEVYKSFYRPKTYSTIESRVRVFLAWLKNRPDTTVTKELANQFILAMLAKKRPATVLGYRRSLSSLYNKKNSHYNPFRGTICPEKQSKSLMYFSRAQVEAIKDYAISDDPQLWLAIRLQYYCYIRPGEMRLLLLSDFNLEHGYIDLRPEVSKNKKSQKVAIPDQFLQELKALPFTWYPGQLYLFSRDEQPGLVPVGKNYFNRRHAAILKALKIIGHYAFYSWKHTGVVMAYRAGIGIKDLQLQLRHHSLDMVNEYLKNLGVLDSDDLRNRFPTI